MEKQKKNIEIPITDNFLLEASKKLGSGAFGDIYLGINKKNKEKVAVKLEPSKTKNPQLFLEAKIYDILKGGSKILFNIIYFF
jgi:predicted Ser/Thr protein kinase